MGLHAVREHGLGAVEAGVGENSEEQKRREGDAQQRSQGEVGERQPIPIGARPEPRVRARLDRCEGHLYLLVAARCVPVNVYWSVEDLFWNVLPAPLGKVSVTRR